MAILLFEMKKINKVKKEEMEKKMMEKKEKPEINSKKKLHRISSFFYKNYIKQLVKFFSLL
jgi:hypothetical protein